MINRSNDGVYFPDPGTVKEAYCGICNEKMNVQRNVCGPTQWAMAVSRSKRKHDAFMCPNYDELWHKRILDLKSEKFNSKSRKIRRLLDEEIKEILDARKLPDDDDDDD